MEFIFAIALSFNFNLEDDFRKIRPIFGKKTAKKGCTYATLAEII